MQPLRLGGVPEHFNYPWHLALAENSGTPLHATWEDQPGGTGEMVAKLGDGQLDVVSILTEGTVAAIDQGLAVTILQVYVSSPLQWGIFVPGTSSLESTDDLSTARIAISRFGSGSHLIAYVLADRDNWSIDAKRFVVAGNLDGAVQAFAEGQAELFLWDQYMTRPLVDSGEFRQLGVLETPWPPFVIAVRDEILQARTTEVGQVVDAVCRQAAALHRRPRIEDELADRYQLPLDSVRGWLATTSFAPRGPVDSGMLDKVRSVLASVRAVDGDE